ncbi:MAG: hypothetical protein COT13_00785 [Chloroflexi bacterium CG08_land_8_20_14_0_20_45_12]|nr:MAG: hypothetical protein AUK00_04415 [Dehalococcoidia bacterium CG2_30_46_9]PIU23857.1 MAG: hypothetical protein COT13_00785 [Chloroflexi bacterium CG08_land_8_20_14_0_20_45_12]PIX27083.1 MAG: hypothetical protein COZ67_04185 [Chloroflexi bacterium CG_4_8_14_3_um_filter_45_15]
MKASYKRRRLKMPEARCPKCGAHYYGWALTDPEHQTCSKCGTKLEIYQEKGKIAQPADLERTSS